MMQIIYKSFLLFHLVLPIVALANDHNNELSKLFTDRNVKGTIIFSSLDGDIEYVFNKKRSEKRFSPVSTFKIPNTLIAFDEGAVADEMETIQWDGEDKGWEPWNRDQSLKTAFPISCVWFYQELAKRVGDTNYLFHLDRLNYRNEKTGPEVSTFWLEGELAISAREQIVF